jgi:hypothetical protein
MSFSTFSGPLRSGTVREGSGRNTGLAVLAQSYDTGDLTGATVGNVDVAAFKIPAGSQIVDIVVDQVVAAATGTTTVSVGSTSGGAELMAAVATTAGGRFRGTATAATQLAWQTSNSTDTQIYIRDAVGTGTLTAGRFIVTVQYVQRAVINGSAAQNPASA